MKNLVGFRQSEKLQKKDGTDGKIEIKLVWVKFSIEVKKKCCYK